MMYDPFSRLPQLHKMLQQLELQRQVLKRKGLRLGLLLGGILWIAGGLALYWWIDWPGLILATGATIAVCFITIQAQRPALNQRYKTEIIPLLVEAASPGAHYTPQNGIEEEIFNLSGLFGTRPDRYHSEDLVEGQTLGTPFRFAEVHAEERRTSTDSKGRTQTHWVDIFRGFLFVADLGRSFPGNTTVYRNPWIKLRFGFPRVKLESPDFEKQFDVYGNDPVEARYLLTPLLMERILQLDQRFGEGLTMSFRDNLLIIAIADPIDHFEASLWLPLTDRSRLEREWGTLSDLCGIVSTLQSCFRNRPSSSL